jgi:hypothetical protein
MDLSKVLGEFYDEHEEDDGRPPTATVPTRADLAAALSEAVAEPDAGPEPDVRPDAVEAGEDRWAEADDRPWTPAPALLEAGPAVEMVEERAGAALGDEPLDREPTEPAPSWHRGDDDVLPQVRKAHRFGGRGRS